MNLGTKSQAKPQRLKAKYKQKCGGCEKWMKKGWFIYKMLGLWVCRECCGKWQEQVRGGLAEDSKNDFAA